MKTNTIKLKNNRTLSFVQYGDSNGKPVFLFHGLHSCRLEGAILSNETERNHIRLIVFDCAGMGQSSYHDEPFY